MPFDSNISGDNAEIESTGLSGQFQGLYQIIKDKPAATDAQEDAVTPLPIDSMPNANVSLTGNNLPFTSDLPARPDCAVLDSVANVSSADPARAFVSLISTELHFNLSITRGFHAVAGAPEEVSDKPQNSAIGGTSRKSNGIGTTDTTFSYQNDWAL